ncbi:MAG: 16S rRNA (uracil(1498)-N(3))-methyltransferase [Treponema sp.]|nr:16S rRNA (uracil(1498)-N(3))-methyltransferase [Treponema sp.]
MKKFILESAPDSDGLVRILGKDYHYLAHVRRVVPGDQFMAVLLDGTETELMICSTDGNAITAQCLQPQPVYNSPIAPIILFQALPKGNKMDLIIRQAAEGGISEIVPFESEYSIKIKASVVQNRIDKVQRWQRIIREARQQSGSSTPTTVKSPLDFDGLLDYWEGLKKEYDSPGTGILLHHEMLGAPLDKGAFHDYLDNNPSFVVLAVGPEGGFSPGEASLFVKAGFRPIKMGNTVLKTETAALYGAAAIRIILLESDSWLPKKRKKL